MDKYDKEEQALVMDDVIQIVTPEPDSQYRLRSCPGCGGDNVAYVQRKTNMVMEGEMWHGKCFDCGYTGKGAAVRHDAQINWNQEGHDGKTDTM